MIKMSIRILLYGLIALLMPLLVHAEEEQTDLCLNETIIITRDSENMTQGYFATDCLTINSSTSYYVSDFIELDDYYYTFEKNYNGGNTSSEYWCYYDENKNVIGRNNIWANYQRNTGFTLDTNFSNFNPYNKPKYVRVNIKNVSTNELIIKSYNLCSNTGGGGNIDPDTPIDNTPTPIQQTYINLGVVGIGLLFAIFIIGGRK